MIFFSLMFPRLIAFLFCWLYWASSSLAQSSSFNVGVGVHDVTGPVAGVNLMGYARLHQMAQGIQSRLRSRAFVFEDQETRRIAVYCVVDAPMLSQLIKKRVVERLQNLYGERYRHDNVMLSATHTHAGLGGYQGYLMYDVTTFGYIPESAEAMVEGIVMSIQRAHRSLRPSQLHLVADGPLLFGANINRSPTSYLANPKAERDLYRHEGDTDKRMVYLEVTEAKENGLARAFVNWFPVHCVSLNNSNRLVSGDNKGYASYLFESFLNRKILSNYTTINVDHNPLKGKSKDNRFPWTGKEMQDLLESGEAFVAAFAQSNEGDVSPNTGGAFCKSTGESCDPEHSACRDRWGRWRNDDCQGRGPAWTEGDLESTRFIGRKQFHHALYLMRNSTKEPVINEGGIQTAHAWVDMTQTVVLLSNGTRVRTCPAARGSSFAAGTTDGPGAVPWPLDMLQGMNRSKLVNLALKPSAQQVACHWPKPILLNGGALNVPYSWEPSVVELQMMRLGRFFFILSIPAELTTMSGRRLRSSVASVIIEQLLLEEKSKAGHTLSELDQTKLKRVFEQKVKVVIAGLGNEYAGYVSTPEEYQRQRYEAASTLFGPYTLNAYIQESQRLAQTLFQSNTNHRERHLAARNPQLPPKDLPATNRLLQLLPPIVFDAVPFGRQFGQVMAQPEQSIFFYNSTNVIQATFHAGHPRNRLTAGHVLKDHLEKTFMAVEKYQGPSIDELRKIVREQLQNNGVPVDGKEIRIQAGLQKDQMMIYVRDKQTILNRGLVYQSNIYKSRNSWRLILQFSNNSRILTSNLKVIDSSEEDDVVQFDARSAHNDQGLSDTPLWRVIRDDGDWDTQFHWWAPSPSLKPISYARLEWYLRQNRRVLIQGSFRFHYYGMHKSPGGHLYRHEGASRVFAVEEAVFIENVWFDL